MAEDKKPKSPEELGEAVGEKIDALFGGMFGDDAAVEPITSTPPPAESAQPVPPTRPVPKPAPEPPRAPEPPAPRPKKSKPKAPPQAPARPAPKPQAAPAVPARAAGPAPETVAGLFDDIEVAILNLEWEISLETVKELTRMLGELSKAFPSSPPAQELLQKNLKALGKVASPGASPHPQLVRMIQETIGVLKQVHSSKGKKPPDPSMSAGIEAMYREIVGPEALEEPPPVKPAAPDQKVDYRRLVKQMGGAVHSIEEVGQRLARIMAVLRQGSRMSTEEITRRLGTLESLLSERIGQLNNLHDSFSNLNIEPNAAQGNHGQAVGNSSQGEGLLLISWQNVPLALPSTIIAALYPLAPTMAEQIKDKRVIAMGSRELPKLPLSRPKGMKKEKPPMPSWLVHVVFGEKHYFILADKALGYRRLPEGTDLSKNTRIKIGNTLYFILSRGIVST